MSPVKHKHQEPANVRQGRDRVWGLIYCRAIKEEIIA